MRRPDSPIPVLVLASLAATGCLDRELKPLNPCLVSGVVSRIEVNRVDKIDLLFVIDDSKSMREEQELLAREFPRLIRVLTTGDRDGDGSPDFPPANDLHLGVVSTDLGLPGIPDFDSCRGFGDDGVLQHAPPPDLAECAGSYPPFISYRADLHDPLDTAADFGCIATLGTDGCGYEQQLEAGLKALWPSIDRDPETGEIIEPNRVRFLTDQQGFGGLGHGDVENAGFLRTDPTDPSVLAVIFVTDEEDCSSKIPNHFIPASFLDPMDPLASQDPNLRCFLNPDNLYGIDRYVDAFRALRPGLEDLLVFGAIVGVPEDLVDADARAAVDFENEASRNAYYDSILAHPDMQERIDESLPEGARNLAPSCFGVPDSQGVLGKAYPARRFVQLAKALGESAVLQSICQDDFGPAMDLIVDMISQRIEGLCLPKQLVRDSTGQVGCEVVWELPAPGAASVDTPTSCAQAAFLESFEPARVSEGGEVCRVKQVPIIGQQPALGAGVQDGWFYDDFSQDVVDSCPAGLQQKIGFTELAAPPKGVTVKLECLDERPTLAESGNDLPTALDAPTIGSPCELVERGGVELRGDAACEVRLNAVSEAFPDGVDRSLFCHPQLNVCMRPCGAQTDCPPAWICDDRSESVRDATGERHPQGTPVCINPTCGDGD